MHTSGLCFKALRPVRGTAPTAIAARTGPCMSSRWRCRSPVGGILQGLPGHGASGCRRCRCADTRRRRLLRSQYQGWSPLQCRAWLPSAGACERELDAADRCPRRGPLVRGTSLHRSSIAARRGASCDHGRAGDNTVCGSGRVPRLLMLSGVGNAEQLHRYGITVVSDLPGVGENLQDHCFMVGFVGETVCRGVGGKWLRRRRFRLARPRRNPRHDGSYVSRGRDAIAIRWPRLVRSARRGGAPASSRLHRGVA